MWRTSRTNTISQARACAESGRYVAFLILYLLVYASMRVLRVQCVSRTVE